jgi:hypothetical protein
MVQTQSTQGQTTEGRATQAELKPKNIEGSMASINRRAMFGAVGAAVAALATRQAKAQTETNGPPAGGKAVPGNAPAITDKSNITQLPNRGFCMDDGGRVLVLDESQVHRIGQEVQGLPSNGEAFRAICEGVEHLKSMNGGQIPPGNDVKLWIRDQNGENLVRPVTLNPAKLSTIADLCPAALNAAMADPMNRKAIDKIRSEVNIHVLRTGQETLTVTFIAKDPGESVMLSVELAPRQ